MRYLGIPIIAALSRIQSDCIFSALSWGTQRKSNRKACNHPNVVYSRRGLFFSVTSTVCMHFESSAKAFVLC